MITRGSALAKWRVTSAKISSEKSPRLVNSMQRAPPAAQAVIAWMQTCGRFGSFAGSYSADYNGYRPNPGVTEQYRWQQGPTTGPTPSVMKPFSTLAALTAATGLEQHGVELDVDAFEKMTLPDKDKPHEVYHAMDLTFRLRPGGKAVDAGDRILGVNDDFTGAAPDLGALELGQPEPHYGPRWLNFQPFYR